MKSKAPKPKNVRAVRLSDTMWKKIQSMAAVVEMRPSEFIRRVLEDRIAELSKREEKS
jgi:predicted DNA-binding ribbon-helix-helix protein